jgi:hypothetical protein
MGFLTVVLGMLVGGHILGIWRACTLSCERQRAYALGAQEPLSTPFLLPIRTVARTRESSR